MFLRSNKSEKLELILEKIRTIYKHEGNVRKYSIFIENRIKSSEKTKHREQKITNITTLKRATHTGMRMHLQIHKGDK